MTNVTGSNNLSGLFGQLFETIENVTNLVTDAFEDKVGGSEQSEESDGAVYKFVHSLGLSDALVLDDGSWQITAIEEDAFDPDRVAVYLENGENYSLIRTSMVWVV